MSDSLVAAPSRTHELKCVQPYFGAIENGSKPFEARKDDRGFAVGDTLWLREYDPKKRSFTGRFLHRRVTYLLAGGQFGVQVGYVVMGLERHPISVPCPSCWEDVRV